MTNPKETCEMCVSYEAAHDHECGVDDLMRYFQNWCSLWKQRGRLGGASGAANPVNSQSRVPEMPHYTCPWCSEPNFDLVGLKGHIQHGECEPFLECACTSRFVNIAA